MIPKTITAIFDDQAAALRAVHQIVSEDITPRHDIKIEQLDMNPHGPTRVTIWPQRKFEAKKVMAVLKQHAAREIGEGKA